MQKFIFLNMSIAHPSVKIDDGTHLLVLGNGVQAAPSLTLTDVLYVPHFPVNLLSIGQLTKQNNYKITFFSFSLCGLRPVDWEGDWFGA